MSESDAIADFRNAHCDVCEQTKAMRASGGRFFFASHLIGSAVSDFGGLLFIASCETCQLDVCSSCCEWQTGPVPEPKMAAALGSAASAFSGVCPRCKSLLVDKTNSDLRLLLEHAPGFSSVEPGERRNRLGRRLNKAYREQEDLLATVFPPEQLAGLREAIRLD